MVDALPRRLISREQSREERLEILRLLEGGTITVEEAATLLDALDRSSPSLETNGTTAPRAAARQLRIRVTDSASGRAVVNIAVPLGLIKSGLDIAGHFIPAHLLKTDAVRQSLSDGFHGALVDVDDGGQRVEIIAE